LTIYSLRYVDIKENGAILLGRNYTVDGFYRRPIHVITHAHADHLGGLDESIKYVEAVIATPATIELILELGYVLNTSI
jgi:putative mRNA 3-end processing factor